jgi:hypothetical protein
MNPHLLYLNVPAAVGDEVSEWLLLEAEGFTSFTARGHSKTRMPDNPSEQVAGFEPRLMFVVETVDPQGMIVAFRSAFHCDHRAWIVPLTKGTEI